MSFDNDYPEHATLALHLWYHRPLLLMHLDRDPHPHLDLPVGVRDPVKRVPRPQGRIHYSIAE